MSSSKLVKFILDPKKNWLAAKHKQTIETRLRKYGLRYDDLYDPMESLDIKEALNRLPREIVDARNQRILRAMDLSMKHERNRLRLGVISLTCWLWVHIYGNYTIISMRSAELMADRLSMKETSSLHIM
ncbi:cytochrome b-c1 complex subunit 7 [Artemisia annua]|uniref:Cytochrome b-c1 complex subunit 7 n=1 Tax=Artemisia annua TaxID=35608 RepID=A0A2U1KH43_ARTAN|nr:cytochrome b-c1 complex subunit 7 [Artemisia annua]